MNYQYYSSDPYVFTGATGNPSVFNQPVGGTTYTYDRKGTGITHQTKPIDEKENAKFIRDLVYATDHKALPRGGKKKRSQKRLSRRQRRQRRSSRKNRH